MIRGYFSKIILPSYSGSFDYILDKPLESLLVSSGIVKIPKGLYVYIDFDNEVNILNNNTNFKGTLYWVNFINDVYINITSDTNINYQKFE